mgnify:CR=1 FL=1|jgi:hypothetical protein
MSIECPTCLETMEQPMALPCLHTFCKSCAADLGASRPLKCPICRHVASTSKKVDPFKPNYALAELMEQLKQPEPPKCTWRTMFRRDT